MFCTVVVTMEFVSGEGDVDEGAVEEGAAGDYVDLEGLSGLEEGTLLLVFLCKGLRHHHIYLSYGKGTGTCRKRKP
jgi:hypothetical protein